MASIPEKPEDTNTKIKDLPVNQSPSVRHLEDLDGKISDRREQIELCNMILNDLLEIQKTVAERGLEDTSCGEPDN